MIRIFLFSRYNQFFITQSQWIKHTHPFILEQIHHFRIYYKVLLCLLLHRIDIIFFRLLNDQHQFRVFFSNCEITIIFYQFTKIFIKFFSPIQIASSILFMEDKIIFSCSNVFISVTETKFTQHIQTLCCTTSG